jgi:hypothetical protein
MIAGGQRINLIEMIAFDPILKFAGLIAGVLSDFEHCDDNYLDFNRIRSGAQGRSVGEKHGERDSCGEA